MISPAQIRAARSLLDWTQAELAKKTGISLRTLNNIERALTVPRLDNLRFIQEALEKAGIEFSEYNGVRQKTERLETVKLEGEEYFNLHVLDIIQEMRTPGAEILYNVQSDENYDKLPTTILDEYWSHLHRYQITERSLVARGNTYIMGLPATYRWLRRSMFNHVGYMVYGDNVAFLIASEPHRMIIIRNPGVADMFRRQFEANWTQAEVPWFATKYPAHDPSEPWSTAKAAAARDWIAKAKEQLDLKQ